MPAILLKKTSTCKTFDVEYLDEISESRVAQRARDNDVSIEDIEEQNGLMQRSIDYLSKEDMGKVHAAGFIRERLLEEKGTAPETWDNDRRKAAISREFEAVTARFGDYRGSTGHRLVFSIDPDLQERLEKTGINVDYVLSREMKRAMSDFQKEFFPGDQIGYAWGIHHDTDNRHIHVFLSNRTKMGVHVPFSNPLKGKRSPHAQADQIGYVKKRLELAGNRIEALIGKTSKDLEQAPLQSITISQSSQRQNLRRIREPETRLIRSADAAAIAKQVDDVARAKREYEARAEAVRRLAGERIVAREMITRGYADVKEIGKDLGVLYESVKATRTSVYPRKLVRQLSFRSGPVGMVARLINHFVYARKDEDRRLIQRAIEDRKFDRAELMQQVARVKAQEEQYARQLRFAREKRDEAAKRYYGGLNQLRRDSDRREIAVFLNASGSREMVNLYFSALRGIKDARAERREPKQELEFLANLASRARSANAQAATQEDLQRLRNAVATGQGRGPQGPDRAHGKGVRI